MLKVDLHIHSVNSGHAYGTINEIIACAQKKNMEMIAITDHGPAMEGTNGLIHFSMGSRAPKTIGDLILLWGCEANLISTKGEIDIPDDLLKILDVVILGFHKSTPYKDAGKTKNTTAMLKALDNPHIDILAHPLHHYYPCDCEKILKKALEKNILPELNISYFKRFVDRDLDKFKKMVTLVKQHKKKIIINSDAHFTHEIGDDSILKKYWQMLGLHEDIIMNNHPKKLVSLFSTR